MDGPVTRRKYEANGMASFDTSGSTDTLESLDVDDSSITVVENERQHGRLRVYLSSHLAVAII